MFACACAVCVWVCVHVQCVWVRVHVKCVWVRVLKPIRPNKHVFVPVFIPKLPVRRDSDEDGRANAGRLVRCGIVAVVRLA